MGRRPRTASSAQVEHEAKVLAHDAETFAHDVEHDPAEYLLMASRCWSP
jgi:hypothetical protein